MATVTHVKTHSDDRYRINLGGTKAVFDFCHRYGVKQAIFVGRHTYYGAAPDSPGVPQPAGQESAALLAATPGRDRPAPRRPGTGNRRSGHGSSTDT